MLRQYAAQQQMSMPTQALQVGPPGDRFEREAHAASAAVMAGRAAGPISSLPAPASSSSGAQRAALHEDDKHAQRAALHEEDKHAQRAALHEDDKHAQRAALHEEYKHAQRAALHEDDKHAQRAALHEEDKHAQRTALHEEDKHAQRAAEMEETRVHLLAQALCADCAADQAQRAPADKTSAGLDTTTAARAIAATGGGSPLEPELKQAMERSFGRDFGAVRVHTGATAQRAAMALKAPSLHHRP